MTESLFLPIDSFQTLPVTLLFNGNEIKARKSDTLLAALLWNGTWIGASEFDATPRAGFCLMGSCQECTLWDQDGHRLRACMTEVREGMSLRSTPYADMSGDE